MLQSTLCYLVLVIWCVVCLLPFFLCEDQSILQLLQMTQGRQGRMILIVQSVDGLRPNRSEIWK